MKKLLIIFFLFFTNFAYADNNEINLINFNSFFKKPIGPLGLEINPDIMKINNKKVQLTGFMEQKESDPVGQFVLSPRPIKTSEDSDGDASDLPPSATLILLDKDQRNMIVPYKEGLITVEGILKVGRFEQEDGSVSWFRIELPKEAIKVSQNIQIQH
jgi:hypothetical protein